MSRRLRSWAAALAAVSAISLVAAAGARPAAGDLVLVANPDADGFDGVDADGLVPSISEDGRFVALIADYSANGTEVLLRNMDQPGLGPPGLISVAPSSSKSEEVTYDADSPGISADGRTLVFASEDPALSDEDIDFDRGPLGEPTNNPIRDIFAYDRLTKSTTLVSRRSGATGQTANDDSNLPALSPDGRYAAFGTESSNLTAGKRIIGGTYVRDLKAKVTTLASRADGAKGKPLGGFEPTISKGGRMVAFVWSFGHGFGRSHRNNEISVRDTRRKKTPFASRASGTHGAIANDDCSEPSISANGRYVAFTSKATNLVGRDDHKVEDVFVRDLKKNRTILVSRGAGVHGAPGSGDSGRAAISADGRYVAFQSYASNLGPHDNPAFLDIFVRDLRTGKVYLASQGDGGAPANAPSASPSISPDGRFVAFNSKATNLSPEDTDRKIGVFRYQILP
jgi:Tol biopolymer transport system component